MRCPNCGSHCVGQVGMGQYFCSDCYVEFKASKKRFMVFGLDEEGTLIPLKEMASQSCDRQLLKVAQ